MILIYIVLASLSGGDVKVNESITFANMIECKSYVNKNANDTLASAGRAYGNKKIIEMGCVSMSSLKLQPVFYFDPM